MYTFKKKTINGIDFFYMELKKNSAEDLQKTLINEKEAKKAFARLEKIDYKNKKSLTD